MIDTSEIASDLAIKGWSVRDSFFPTQLCLSLRSEIQDLKRQDRLRKSSIGRAHQQKRVPVVRGDYIQWIDNLDLRPTPATFLSICKTLYTDLGRHMYQPFNAFESHYAFYPKGTRYQKHLDRFQNSNDRVLSLVLYLNQDWQPLDGGELEIYKESDPSVVETLVTPTLGKLVIFLSGRIYHAVRPTLKPRYSVAGWVRHQQVQVNPLAILQ